MNVGELQGQIADEYTYAQFVDKDFAAQRLNRFVMQVAHLPDRSGSSNSFHQALGWVLSKVRPWYPIYLWNQPHPDSHRLLACWRGWWWTFPSSTSDRQWWTEVTIPGIQMTRNSLQRVHSYAGSTWSGCSDGQMRSGSKFSLTFMELQDHRLESHFTTKKVKFSSISLSGIQVMR